MLAVILSSCSGYQRLLKSNDNQAKYERARELHAKGNYMRAATLLESALPYFRGTQKAGPILFLLADCYFQNKNYQTAINYFMAYNANFPRGEHAMEARFLIGYSFYQMSPDPRLDQSATHSAIEAFQTFLELFPHSERVSEASRLQLEMFEKLAYKELLNARLYFRLGNFQGNNYRSAVIVAQNALNDFPFTQYREEFRILILRSKYQQAVKSIAARRDERFREAIDEYFVYASEFPTGRFIREAERMLEDSRRNITN